MSVTVLQYQFKAILNLRDTSRNAYHDFTAYVKYPQWCTWVISSQLSPVHLWIALIIKVFLLLVVYSTSTKSFIVAFLKIHSGLKLSMLSNTNYLLQIIACFFFTLLVSPFSEHLLFCYFQMFVVNCKSICLQYVRKYVRIMCYLVCFFGNWNKNYWRWGMCLQKMC